MYKESLRAATRTLSRDSTGPREFRITVTDHTGARGTDYQMLDEVADKLGGLMLVVMHVPPSRRDWIQYKGRTARQNWRGQYCVVLNAEEYRELDQAGAQTALPRAAYSLRPGGAPYVPENPEDLVEHILNYGAEESKRRLESCEASYNAGFIANEVCERVWTQPGWFKAQAQSSGTAKVDVNLEGAGRAAFLDLCQRYRYKAAKNTFLQQTNNIANNIEPTTKQLLNGNVVFVVCASATGTSLPKSCLVLLKVLSVIFWLLVLLLFL
ncbi:unnamed protein product [Polarella glacialis]|uniref:Uncharacterized protein n=1 Tax=Polarella glacialis TaxID=89957 RepID=A0A813IY51_POLGL|nr:unnamed protein product [Polarella glacialis]CAE8650549.1 unnamed protein product [Polarella glacialis]CAE8659596.1 unnamed protein product [Polarella glacialis]